MRPLVLFAVSVALSANLCGAEQNPHSDEQLVERIKAEVIQELRDSEFLRSEIEAGIEDYIKTQRSAREQAQAQARIEQERIASEKASKVRRITAGRDHVYGNPAAPISLIEYSDFECPYCKRFHTTARQLIDQSDGKVNWVYRHYPLNFHNPGAQKQAEASECAHELGGNEAFWRYTDALYQRTRSGGEGFPLEQLTPLAEAQGLEGARFQACIDSERHKGRVQQDFDEGVAAGITGTPGNILVHNSTGEVRLRSGAKPLQAFQADVQEMLGSPTRDEPESTSSQSAGE
ncbi:DsbA family protein [Marinobacterium rhizophilum]|uniref:Thioredoxin domain-containing protein n=1 Tax=Marinobacterium rhizophilum TaxID=420402 RepID=A0ABY5HQE2_9GAMM|nr:thioredoxin domain-containing protein [Marinobacterium rhizophilum]UTW13427.1 thioredoxin domain-containing protein [Marinobacterium rhizophilum]